MWLAERVWRTRFYRLVFSRPGEAALYHAAVVDDFGRLVIVDWEWG